MVLPNEGLEDLEAAVLVALAKAGFHGENRLHRHLPVAVGFLGVAASQQLRPRTRALLTRAGTKVTQVCAEKF